MFPSCWCMTDGNASLGPLGLLASHNRPISACLLSRICYRLTTRPWILCMRLQNGVSVHIYPPSSITWSGFSVAVTEGRDYETFFLYAFTYFLRSFFRIRKIVFKNKSDDKVRHTGKDTEPPWAAGSVSFYGQVHGCAVPSRLKQLDGHAYGRCQRQSPADKIMCAICKAA